jgi:hypothetical protein
VKTAYRIVPITEYGVTKLYLQFATVRTRRVRVSPWWRLWGRKYEDRTVDVWRYVPDDEAAYLHGYYQCPADCPTTITRDNQYDVRGEYTFSESALRWFVEKYPRIEDFFAEMLKRREEHLAGKERDRQYRTTYL